MKHILFVVLSFISISVFSQKKDTVTTASGLKYVRIKAGNGVKPVDGQKLKVIYKGKNRTSIQVV